MLGITLLTEKYTVLYFFVSFVSFVLFVDNA